MRRARGAVVTAALLAHAAPASHAHPEVAGWLLAAAVLALLVARAVRS